MLNRIARLVATAAAATAMLLTVGAVAAQSASAAVPTTKTAAATVHPLVSTNSTAPCVNDATDFCRTAVPQHVGSGPNCTAFPDGNYWETKNDALGHPISWTYANGSTPCVRVSFTARAVSTQCSFWIYVPDGNATATFTLGWQDTNGNWHTTEAVNENSVTGWSLITMYSPSQRTAANVTQLYFQDNNGQAYPSEIGWGTSNQYGIWQAC